MSKTVIPQPATGASQNKLIRQHLEAGKSITQLQAFKLFGCLRLSGRIYDLSHDEGLNIKSTIVTIGSKRVARYSLSN
jgi:hypothetical protein